jgi:hypothetical protein
MIDIIWYDIDIITLLLNAEAIIHSIKMPIVTGLFIKLLKKKDGSGDQYQAFIQCLYLLRPIDLYVAGRMRRVSMFQV